MDAVGKTGWSSAEVDSSLGKKQGKKPSEHQKQASSKHHHKKDTNCCFSAWELEKVHLSGSACLYPQ